MDASDVVASAAVAPPPHAPAPARRLRYWLAALTLYFLSPLIAEVMSGSTPPLLFVQPFGFIFTPLLYGSSAILIHEVVVRQRLGWGNVLLLGAAFGVFQEALVVQTWFTYMAPSSPAHMTGAYGVLWGISWNWAFSLTVYHAIISIVLPLILIDLFFPRRARRPWLGPRRIVALSLWLVIPCGLLAYGVAFTQFAKEGYHGPPLFSYLATVAITIALIALGVFVRFPAPRATPTRRAPRPAVIGWACFGLTVLFFAVSLILPSTPLPAVGTLAIQAAIFGFSLWRIQSWSARLGWGARHRLAIVAGVVAYFVFLWGPLIEYGFRLAARAGLVIFDLTLFALLAVFAWRLKKRVSTAASADIAPPGVG